jgi:TrmH family RNA methyltransferase
MGSVFVVPIAHCGEAEFLAWRGRLAGLVAGTHLSGKVDYRAPDYSAGPVVLLMGNEQHGLSRPLAGCCDVLVRIPQAGQADSLNLAVSTALMIYEIRRGALRLEPGEAP